MAAEGGNHIIRFTYTGEEGEIIPLEATHIFVDVRVVTAGVFYWHENIVEIICSERVEKVERWAFRGCDNLSRVIMPGVIEVEEEAFSECEALTDLECGKLEIIRCSAFVK